MHRSQYNHGLLFALTKGLVVSAGRSSAMFAANDGGPVSARSGTRIAFMPEERRSSNAIIGLVTLKPSNDESSKQ